MVCISQVSKSSCNKHLLRMQYMLRSLQGAAMHKTRQFSSMSLQYNWQEEIKEQENGLSIKD